MIIYTDRVIKQIGKNIASHEAERGGALLGIPNSNLITSFIEDPLANVTHASYFPSKELTSKVNDKELHHGLEFKGVIHSHPGDFNIPSDQDENAFALGLSINPRLAGFVAPIVTLTSLKDRDDVNEIKLNPRGQLTSYIAYRKKQREQSMFMGSILCKKEPSYGEHKGSYFSRESNSDVVVEKTPCAIMPIDAHTSALTKMLESGIGKITDSSEGYLEINGVLFLSITYRFIEIEIIILFPPDYPMTKPVILASKILQGKKEDAVEISFHWRLFSDSGDLRLANLCGNEIINFLKTKETNEVNTNV